MKNYIWLVFIGFLLVTACEKDQMNDNVELISTEVSKVLHVDVDNNMLIFDSKEHFELVLEELGDLSFADWDLWEKSVDFKSIRSVYNESSFLDKNPISDPLIATLLNPDLRIQIGEYIFEINTDDKTVAIVESGDNINFKKTSQVFNYDDEIFSLLENEPVKKGTKCNTKNVKESVYFYWDNYIPCYVGSQQIHYYTLGIYKSLYAEIEKPFVIGSTNPKMKMYVKPGGFYNNTGDEDDDVEIVSKWYYNYDSSGSVLSRNVYVSFYKKTTALRDYSAEIVCYHEDEREPYNGFRELSPIVNICYNP